MKIPGSDSDHEWEKLGATDPYYGVVTHEENKSDNLTDEIKEEFFKSGEEYIAQIINNIQKHLHPGFTIESAIDFGCGVGRLVIPLSKVSEKVVGIDVSDSMINEAKRNCEKYAIENVEFVKSDDQLSGVSGQYSLIHSFIVFQHIPVNRGIEIFKKMLSHLENGGVGVVHFTYAKKSKIKDYLVFLKKIIPFLGNIVNLIKYGDFFAPQMQMNSYNLNKLFFIIQNAGVKESWVELTAHGDELGMVIYFKKPE